MAIQKNLDDNVRKEILVKANLCVNGERDGTYGNPENNFGTIAAFWNAYLSSRGYNVSVSPMDVAAMMALLKLSRIASGGFHIDNWIDLAGYAACGGEIQANTKNG